jgi:hypothetical protein
VVLRPTYIKGIAQRDWFKAGVKERVVYMSVIDGVPVIPKSL